MNKIIAVCVLACLSVGVSDRIHAQRNGPEAAILKADEDFNQSVAQRSKEKFLALIADNATFSGGTANELKGKDAIWKGWSAFFEPNGPRLTWHPTKAEVLAGGDVGYTVGMSERRAPDGKVQHGNYLTVWRKQADGSWKAIFDTGSAIPERSDKRH